MDTRRPIQDNPEPAVLSTAFNNDCTRFVCGMDNGVRVFRAKDCIRTIKEVPGNGHGIAIAETLDDRYLAVVGGGRLPDLSPDKVELWDMVQVKKLAELDMSEPVLGIRMTPKLFIVILINRTVCLEFALSSETNMLGFGDVRGLYHTANNPYALCCVCGDTIALPGLTSAQAQGQVQIINIAEKSKKIVAAHDSPIRQIALSADGELLATASEQGTLIRVFSTKTQTKMHEFRRGVDAATTYGLAISPTKLFIASTSDKGTLHVFDLRPPVTEDTARLVLAQNKRHGGSRPATASRRPRSVDFDNLSLPSGSSSPHTAAGLYGPPPDLAHTPPRTGPSVLSALARVPGVPRAFSDVRSMTSISYHLGADPPNWQGQPAYTATTLPNGHVAKVKNPNVPIPGHPDGKPPKGVLAWDPHSGDRRLWIIGGGADARWEVFELIEEEIGHKMRIVKTGFRRYLTRQFPEEQ
ncbi:hypothetical protein MBLNU459_g7795t1 [Dothideomycetes sp. NU459]